MIEIHNSKKGQKDAKTLTVYKTILQYTIFLVLKKNTKNTTFVFRLKKCKIHVVCFLYANKKKNTKLKPYVPQDSEVVIVWSKNRSSKKIAGRKKNYMYNNIKFNNLEYIFPVLNKHWLIYSQSRG